MIFWLFLLEILLDNSANSLLLFGLFLSLLRLFFQFLLLPLLLVNHHSLKYADSGLTLRCIAMLVVMGLKLSKLALPRGHRRTLKTF
jgi:hypothetical protein